MINRLIKNEEDYNTALSRIEKIMNAKPDTPEMDELELLAALVEMYEEHHFSISWPDPIAAIKFRMEQLCLSQKDLIPYIGNKSKVSEVLNGKRTLSLSMMRGLHKGLGIPADVLLAKPGEKFPETLPDIDWQRFPLKEMARRSWIDGTSEISESSEEVMRPFIEAAGGYEAIPAPLLRQGIAGRVHGNADRYAITAWCLRISALALKNPLATPFRVENLTPKALCDIARLSYFKDGPLLAREYLAKQGIHLIVVRHLAKTYLDGGAIFLPDGNATIAMTLRYDRLDNFWFTLLHELAHLARHLSENCRFIVDDLDMRSLDKTGHDDTEDEADEMASVALIPRRYWPKIDTEKLPQKTEVESLALKLNVHPAVIAGRIRFKRNNHKLFWNLVGNGVVRKLFPEYTEEMETCN